MAITRAKATALLNQREMSLYDDSRANALRTLDQKALTTRISRARDARSRARDLVQRQKLSSRERSGNKRGASGLANQRSKDKAELMADILSRFEQQLVKVKKESAATTSRKTSATAGKSSGSKAATKKTRKKASTGTAAKTAAKKVPAKASKKNAARKSTATKSAKKAVAEAGAGKPAATRKVSASKATTARTKRAGKTSSKTAKRAAPKKATRKLTPKQALKRTKALLEDKKARDHAPKPWESPPTGSGAEGQAGYQSKSAARSARRLHAAETRLPAIMGSVSTRDRINQGKRDRRRSGDS